MFQGSAILVSVCQDLAVMSNLPLALTELIVLGEVNITGIWLVVSYLVVVDSVYTRAHYHKALRLILSC